MNQQSFVPEGSSRNSGCALYQDVFLKYCESAPKWTSFIRIDTQGLTPFSRQRRIQTAYGSIPASKSALQLTAHRSCVPSGRVAVSGRAFSFWPAQIGSHVFES